MRQVFSFLLGVVVIFQADIAASQSLQILNEDDNDADVSDSTLSYTGSVNDNYQTIIGDFKVVNSGNSSLDVKIKKYHVEIVEGTANDFCWNGTCLSATTMLSPTAVTLEPGESADDFDTHYHCMGNSGTSTVRYTAFDANNPADSVMLTVNYAAESTGIYDKPAKLNISDLHPNPAQKYTGIDYNLPAGSELKIIIYNVIGKKIKDYTCFEKGSLHIDLAGLRKGTYICRYSVDGNITDTHKLIIQ
jgi:hypothetical protein